MIMAVKASAEGSVMSSNIGSLLDLVSGPGETWESLCLERRDVVGLDLRAVFKV